MHSNYRVAEYLILPTEFGNSLMVERRRFHRNDLEFIILKNRKHLKFAYFAAYTILFVNKKVKLSF